MQGSNWLFWPENLNEQVVVLFSWYLKPKEMQLLDPTEVRVIHLCPDL